MRRPRPYRRHCGVYRTDHHSTPHAGMPLGAYRQPYSPCGRRAIINGNGVEANNDAARRVATSFEERENRI